MKVWLCTIGQRLDDADNTRTMLLAEYLAQAGHEVTLWTSAFDHIRKEWRKEWREGDGQSATLTSGLVVRFFKGCGYSRNVGPRRLVDHILGARDLTRRAARQEPPDMIIASLPDHVTAAALTQFAKRRGIPVIIDVRDKWPDIFIDHAPLLLKPLVRIMLWRESRRAHRALAGADALIAMMGSMLRWGLNKAERAERPGDRVFYLATMQQSERTEPDLLALQPDHLALLQSLKNKLVFTFVGTFNRTQHPLLVLEAFALLAKRPDFPADRVALLIGGDGVDADIVEQRIAELPFAHRLGWLRPVEMRAFLTRSDVGLLPMNFRSPAFNNKAFAYLACGLPIINGATGDLAELIDTHQLGINVHPGDAEALAAAVLALVEEPSKATIMQGNVRETFARLFDQDTIYRALVSHVEQVSSREGLKSDRIAA